jgi:hypothetical protein
MKIIMKMDPKNQNLIVVLMIAHVPFYGDIMKCFREMHAPGIDILSCFPENMPVHTPKLASSAAELMGGTQMKKAMADS